MLMRRAPAARVRRGAAVEQVLRAGDHREHDRDPEERVERANVASADRRQQREADGELLARPSSPWPSRRAGTRCPAAATNERYTLIADLADGDDQRPAPPEDVVARRARTWRPSTSTLSASGSRNAPERVVPCRRASQPSMPSVAAQHEPQGERGPRALGAVDQHEQERRSSSRAMVTAFAGVAERGRTEASSRHAQARSVGDEVGPERADDRDTSTNAPTASVLGGTSTMPSISGASRWLRADARRVDEHLDRRADQRVTPARR